VVVVWFALFRLAFPSLLHFSTSSSWRYWADSVEVTQAGRIPSKVLQYGSLYPPTVNKVVLDGLNAGVIFAGGREALPGMASMLWIAAVGMTLSLWSLGRELGLRHMAVLLPVLSIANRVFLNPEMTTDLDTFKAELFGRLVAFLALALAVRSLSRRRGWKDALMAGGLLGVAAGIHLIPVIMAGAFVAAYAVARFLADRTAASLASVTRRTAVIGAITVALGSVVLGLPHGNLGLRGAGGEITGGLGPCFDPTRYLNSGFLPNPLCTQPRSWYLSPARAFRDYVASATHISLHSPAASAIRPLELVLLLVGLVVALIMLLRLPGELGPAGVAGWGLMVALVGLTTLFSRVYRLYIPAYVGVRRLFDFSSLPLILLGLALAEGLLLRAAGATRARWLPAVVAVVLIVGTAAALLPRAGTMPSTADRSLVEPFDWIRANVPCDARILANLHTEGVFEALTGRVAVLEGATPYLVPPIRDPIVHLLLAARDFFQDPQAHPAFLQAEGVTYVVVISAGGVGYSEPIGAANRSSLASAPFLRAVHISPAMTIYQVEGLLPHTGVANPATHPGFDCLSGPIAT
jgi:hypothetical protein